MLCFKEWQIICESLGEGKQSLILRKGGIHEGSGGFSFGNVTEFVLFPTRFHAQGDLVDSHGEFSPGKEWEVGDEVVFDTLCKVDETYELTEWSQVEALSKFHLWSEDCIRDRFDWEGKGMASGKIHLALIRSYKMPDPIIVEYAKRLGGCRSWVELNDISVVGEGLVPIMQEDEFSSLKAEISAILS